MKSTKTKKSEEKIGRKARTRDVEDMATRRKNE